MAAVTEQQTSEQAPPKGEAKAPPEGGEAPARNRKGRRRTIYPEAKIEHAFTALALADGNSVQASKALAADGLKVRPRTLNHWAKRSHRDLYLRVKLELVPYLRSARHARYERLARKFAAADDPDNLDSEQI